MELEDQRQLLALSRSDAELQLVSSFSENLLPITIAGNYKQTLFITSHFG